MGWKLVLNRSRTQVLWTQSTKKKRSLAGCKEIQGYFWTNSSATSRARWSDFCPWCVWYLYQPSIQASFLLFLGFFFSKPFLFKFHGIKFAVCSEKRHHVLGCTHLPFVFLFVMGQNMGKLFWLLLLCFMRWLGLWKWDAFGLSRRLVWWERRSSVLAFSEWFFFCLIILW